jgi:cytochrome c peroxidase
MQRLRPLGRELMRRVFAAISVGCALSFASGALAHEPHTCPADFPDTPILAGHINHSDIIDGTLSFADVFESGRQLFVAAFNICDGQGRPATTGGGNIRMPGQPSFIRTSAPDSNACSGCHAQPRTGGAGDFVANVFVLAQTLDPVIESVSSEFSNERNTLGMFGSGAIEMLAREMSLELQGQISGLADGEHTLSSKGADFDVVIEGGKVIASSGLDTDLIIKPFHQAGVVVSVREFSVNAFNHHHGMQAEERFDLNQAKGLKSDFDGDGVQRELTVGDITAATIFQAALGVPGRVLPDDQAGINAVNRGQALFESTIESGGTGCAQCHIPSMTLNSRLFVEPNPFNPDGTFSDNSLSVSFDLTLDGEAPRLEPTGSAGAIVRAYTDMKRHSLCDEIGDPDPIRYFCNEQLDQGRPEQDGRKGAEFFITRKLWDVGSSAPYGHRGDLTTITEAILMHGGEARPSRDAFVGMPGDDQAAIVSFLKTLQVIPETSG